METLFTKIIEGKVPCYKLYENEHVFSFLDISPLSLGHALVVPRQAVAYLHELSEISAAELGKALVKVAGGILKVTGANAYNVLQNNGSTAYQSVFHVHFHIIPQDSKGNGLKLLWNPDKQPSNLEQLSQKVRYELGMS